METLKITLDSSANEILVRDARISKLESDLRKSVVGNEKQIEVETENVKLEDNETFSAANEDISAVSAESEVHTTPDNEEGSVKEAHLASTVAEEGHPEKGVEEEDTDVNALNTLEDHLDSQKLAGKSNECSRVSIRITLD